MRHTTTPAMKFSTNISAIIYVSARFCKEQICPNQFCLKNIHEALHEVPNLELTSFNTDFPKAFVKSHTSNLTKKLLIQERVEACSRCLDYLSNPKFCAFRKRYFQNSERPTRFIAWTTRVLYL